MGQIALSVVIPTYNRAKYIRSAVESVLEQENAGVAFEVIVIDDGSTDGTEKCLAPLNDKITYKRIPNSGRPAVPRNVGIKLAKGDLIAFQDSDDLWVKDKLNKQIISFSNPNVVASYGNATFMDSNGVMSTQTILGKGQGKCGNIFENLLELDFISTLTVMARTDAIRAIGGFNESWKIRGVEDYDLWLRLSLKGEFDFVDTSLAYYRHHEDNISSSDPLTSLERVAEVYKSLLRTKLSHKERKLVHRRIAKLFIETASHTNRIHGLNLRLSSKLHNTLAR